MRTLHLVGFFCAVIAAAAAGYFLYPALHAQKITAPVREPQFGLVSPLLICRSNEDEQYSGFSELKSALAKRIADAIGSKKATRASVYFRDMNLGTWMGLNLDEKYMPSSLTKVPLMMALLLEEREEPSTLETTLTVNERYNLGEHFKPSVELKVGGTYSVLELMEAMIERSDNTATIALAQFVNPKIFRDIFTAAGVEPPQTLHENIRVVGDEMRFFRVLYNASYLDRELSQTGLTMLSKSEFADGLRKGVAADVTMAHKFGEHAIQQRDGSWMRQLHDCGIVYAGETPYGLCIMTEGTDFGALSELIGDLSRETYRAVTKGLLKPAPAYNWGL